MSGKSNPKSVIFNPAEVATLGNEYIGYRKDHKEFGVPFPSMRLSDRVYPLFGGEVMTIIARPGHAKTGLMMAWARQRARWLVENGFKNRVGVYATWEQSIEELHTFHVSAQQKISITKMAKGTLTDEDWKNVTDASVKRVDEPLWFMGHSTMRRSGRNPLTTETVRLAIEEIQGRGYELDFMALDYLQRITPMNGFDNPVMAYSGIMDEIKNIALGYGVPMIVGVQASREVEQLKLQIPEMHHAQWTSNIEQSSDRVLSLVRPRRYKKEGDTFGSVTVHGHSQLLITVLKQKLGEANFAEWIKFNPIYNQLDEMEIKTGGV